MYPSWLISILPVITIVLCLHCCFSRAMKVQSVVGCFRSKFLLKSLVEIYILPSYTSLSWKLTYSSNKPQQTVFMWSITYMQHSGCVCMAVSKYQSSAYCAVYTIFCILFKKWVCGTVQHKISKYLCCNVI